MNFQFAFFCEGTAVRLKKSWQVGIDEQDIIRKSISVFEIISVVLQHFLPSDHAKYSSYPQLKSKKQW